MAEKTVVTCTECAYEEAFSALRHAREAMDAHERETGHTVDWSLSGVASGVEAAGDVTRNRRFLVGSREPKVLGDAAGVCGVSGSSPDSPFWPDDANSP